MTVANTSPSLARARASERARAHEVSYQLRREGAPRHAAGHPGRSPALSSGQRYTRRPRFRWKAAWRRAAAVASGSARWRLAGGGRPGKPRASMAWRAQHPVLTSIRRRIRGKDSCKPHGGVRTAGYATAPRPLPGVPREEDFRLSRLHSSACAQLRRGRRIDAAVGGNGDAVVVLGRLARDQPVR
jgi:hypothetical protein